MKLRENQRQSDCYETHHSHPWKENHFNDVKFLEEKKCISSTFYLNSTKMKWFYEEIRLIWSSIKRLDVIDSVQWPKLFHFFWFSYEGFSGGQNATKYNGISREKRW